MFAKQLTVFIENRAGRLSEVLGVLKNNGVNIISLSLADTTEFGLLRLIVSDSETAKAKLTENGEIPDLYPGVTATVEVVNGVSEAVFHLGTGLVYDRTQDLFFPMGSQLESYFTGVAQ